MNGNIDIKTGTAAKTPIGFMALPARMIMVAGLCLALFAACGDLGGPQRDWLTVVYHSEDTTNRAQVFTERLGENHIVNGGNIFNVAGHRVEYWATGSGEQIKPGDSIKGLSTGETRVDLYAHWLPNTYTVRYFANNGIDDSFYDPAMIFTYGTPQPLKTIAELAFQTPAGAGGFMGWARGPESPTEFTNGQVVFNLTDKEGEQVSLYARWGGTGGGTVTITYDYNNGVDTSGAPSGTISYNIANGDKIILPNADTVKWGGYRFGGWNVNAAGTGTKYNVGDPFFTANDATLYAHWIAINTMAQIPDELCEKWYDQGTGEFAFEFRKDGWFHLPNDDSLGYGVTVNGNALTFYLSSVRFSGANYSIDGNNILTISTSEWAFNIDGTYSK